MSDSKANSYLRCPKAYEFAYEKNIRMKPSWGIRGRAAHAAEEINYRQKLDTHDDLSINDVKDIAASQFELDLHSGKEEIIWGNNE